MVWGRGGARGRRVIMMSLVGKRDRKGSRSLASVSTRGSKVEEILSLLLILRGRN